MSPKRTAMVAPQMDDRVPVVEYMHTHPNCRCVMVPVSKSWTELGYPEVDAAIAAGELPAPPTTQSGEAFLRSLPVAEQQRRMGLARWNAWEHAKGRPGVPDGVGLSLDRMYRDVYHPDWGWQLRLDNFEALLDQLKREYGASVAEGVRDARYPPKAPPAVRRFEHAGPLYAGPLNEDYVHEREQGWRTKLAEEAGEAIGEAPFATDSPEVEQDVEAITKALRSVLDPAKTEVRMRVPEDVLGSILADGRFKNQHETGSSRGFLSQGMRERVEDRAFGPTPDPSQRPVYGYITTNNEDSYAASAYGDVVVRLRDSVDARTTFTIDDSLQPLNEEAVAAVPYLHPNIAGIPNYFTVSQVLNWQGKTTEGAARATFPRWYYVEAQVHGDTTVDDIAEVIFTEEGDREGLTNVLDAMGIPWRVEARWMEQMNETGTVPLPTAPAAVTPTPAVPIAPPAPVRAYRTPVKPRPAVSAPAYAERMEGPLEDDRAHLRGEILPGTTPPTLNDLAIIHAIAEGEGVSDGFVSNIVDLWNLGRQRLTAAQMRAFYRDLMPTEQAVLDQYLRAKGLTLLPGADDIGVAAPPADYVPAAPDLRLQRPTDAGRAAIWDTAVVARKAVASMLGVYPSASRWTGDVIVESNAYPRSGYFNWQGTLAIREATNASIARRVAVSVHEMMHSFSASTPASYRGWPGWEEGVAEGATRVLLREVAETMEYDPDSVVETWGTDGYREYVEPLERIRSALGMPAEQFYAELIKTPIQDRSSKVLSWLRADATLTPQDWQSVFVATRQLDVANPTDLAVRHVERHERRLREAAETGTLMEELRDILDMDAATFYSRLIPHRRDGTPSLQAIISELSLAAQTRLEARRRRERSTIMDEDLPAQMRAEAAEREEALREQASSLSSRLAGLTAGVMTSPEGAGYLLAPETIEEVARRTYEKAKVVEPAITLDIQLVGEQLGIDPDFEGMLQYRLKTESSLKRKIAYDVRTSSTPVSLSEVAANLKDTVRYTYITTEDNYVSAYTEARAALEAKGYAHLRTKNFWAEEGVPTQYQGFNSVFISPDGQAFELQFHTKDSLRAKNANHALKELWEHPDTTEEARAAIEAEMNGHQVAVARPGEVFGPVNDMEGVERVNRLAAMRAAEAAAATTDAMLGPEVDEPLVLSSRGETVDLPLDVEQQQLEMGFTGEGRPTPLVAEVGDVVFDTRRFNRAVERFARAASVRRLDRDTTTNGVIAGPGYRLYVNSDQPTALLDIEVGVIYVNPNTFLQWTDAAYVSEVLDVLAREPVSGKVVRLAGGPFLTDVESRIPALDSHPSHGWIDDLADTEGDAIAVAYRRNMVAALYDYTTDTYYVDDGFFSALDADEVRSLFVGADEPYDLADEQPLEEELEEPDGEPSAHEATHRRILWSAEDLPGGWPTRPLNHPNAGLLVVQGGEVWALYREDAASLPIAVWDRGRNEITTVRGEIDLDTARMAFSDAGEGTLAITTSEAEWTDTEEVPDDVPGTDPTKDPSAYAPETGRLADLALEYPDTYPPDWFASHNRDFDAAMAAWRVPANIDDGPAVVRYRNADPVFGDGNVFVRYNRSGIAREAMWLRDVDSAATIFVREREDLALAGEGFSAIVSAFSAQEAREAPVEPESNEPVVVVTNWREDDIVPQDPPTSMGVNFTLYGDTTSIGDYLPAAVDRRATPLTIVRYVVGTQRVWASYGDDGRVDQAFILYGDGSATIVAPLGVHQGVSQAFWGGVIALPVTITPAPPATPGFILPNRFEAVEHDEWRAVHLTDAVNDVIQNDITDDVAVSVVRLDVSDYGYTDDLYGYFNEESRLVALAYADGLVAVDADFVHDGGVVMRRMAREIERLRQQEPSQSENMVEMPDGTDVTVSTESTWNADPAIQYAIESSGVRNGTRAGAYVGQLAENDHRAVYVVRAEDGQLVGVYFPMWHQLWANPFLVPEPIGANDWRARFRVPIVPSPTPQAPGDVISVTTDDLRQRATNLILPLTTASWRPIHVERGLRTAVGLTTDVVYQNGDIVAFTVPAGERMDIVIDANAEQAAVIGALAQASTTPTTPTPPADPMTQPDPNNSSARVERWSVDQYRDGPLQPFRSVLPDMPDRPRSQWRTYTAGNGTRARIFFDSSGYAQAMQLLDSGDIHTYAGVDVRDERVREWFAGVAGRTNPSPSTYRAPTVPPVNSTARRPSQPVIAGEGYDALPIDPDFDYTVRGTVAQSMVDEGLADKKSDVLNGPPNSFAFIGPWDGGTEAALFYYGPNGGVVAQAWVSVARGGDVTAANPDGYRVTSVHWVKTHTSYRRLGLSTRLYEWATINGFRIEVDSGLHGLTDIGTKYWRARRARPFSRIVMASSRWLASKMGDPTSLADVVRARKRKVVKDAATALPKDLADAGVPLMPEDAPASYDLGRSNAYGPAVPAAEDPAERTGSVVTRPLFISEDTIGRFENGAEPSQTIEFDPTLASLDDIDFAAAYTVRKHKQDATIVTLVGDIVRRLELPINGESLRLEGLPLDRMDEIYDDLGHFAPNATLHDQTGFIEMSVYDSMKDDDVLEGFRQMAAKYGARMRVLPAHIRWYWHDKSTYKAARHEEGGEDGWFQGPEDASFIAGDVRQRLVASGDARADRIVARRRTPRRPDPTRAGSEGVRGGDTGVASDDGGAGDVRAFRRFVANAQRATIEEEGLEPDIYSDLPASVDPAGLVLVQGGVEDVLYSDGEAVAAFDKNADVIYTGLIADLPISEAVLRDLFSGVFTDKVSVVSDRIFVPGPTRTPDEVLAETKVLADALMPIIERVTGRQNIDWNGQVVLIDPNDPNHHGATAAMNWDGTLAVDPDQMHLPREQIIHVIVHELLHAVAGTTPAQFTAAPWLEEGVTELTTRLVLDEVLREFGIAPSGIASYAYEAEVSTLETIATELNIPVRTFVMALLAVPNHERMAAMAKWARERSRNTLSLRMLARRFALHSRLGSAAMASETLLRWDAIQRVMGVDVMDFWQAAAGDPGYVMTTALRTLTSDPAFAQSERGQLLLKLLGGGGATEAAAHQMALDIVAGRVTLAPTPVRAFVGGFAGAVASLAIETMLGDLAARVPRPVPTGSRRGPGRGPGGGDEEPVPLEVVDGIQDEVTVPAPRGNRRHPVRARPRDRQPRRAVARRVARNGAR